MSKINQIQQQLKAIDSAAFQKLCDAYLHLRGYEQINPLGSVIGADRVAKGTPDTWFSLPNGNYIFAEYTAQESQVFAKLSSDLAKCFDETKTGLSVQKIEAIVFCHTDVLKPAQEETLREVCRRQGCGLALFGMGALSHDLLYTYPGLAKEYFGIEIDTGQIVTLNEFVAAYNKNAFAAPLDTAFQFRENEINHTLQALRDGNLILLAGKPGVGKTRLAMECCARFTEENPDFKTFCIFNRGINLHDDVRSYFSPPGNYLIFVDDANRTQRCDYILYLLHEVRTNRHIKIIATVRDYARTSILNAARNYGCAELTVSPFQDEQIKQLVQTEYQIHNDLFLDRIAQLAQGNPRIAVMAAQVIIREGTFESVYDVSNLYDEYFRSIREDMEALRDTDLLKTVAVIAFFRTLNRSHSEGMQEICDAFGLSVERFWKAAQRLHEMEVVDMYENEVVKVSDQILATYLFYLAVFKEREINFSVLLEQFFFRHKTQFMDALHPVLTAFDAETIIQQMRPALLRVWPAIEEQGDEAELFDFIKAFWFAMKPETLLYIRNRIASLQADASSNKKLLFKPRSDIPDTSLLTLLRPFCHADIAMGRMALNLICDYLDKCPSEVSHVLRLLLDSYGFHYTSYMRLYEVQRAVLDILWGRTQEGENRLYSQTFITVCVAFLRTRFDIHEGRDGGRSIAVTQFNLGATPELVELRRAIWQRLFTLYRQPALQENVVGALQTYCHSGYEIANKEIIERDAQDVLPFIADYLDPSKYAHCVVVQDYRFFLGQHGISVPQELADRFVNETYTLAEVLLPNIRKRAHLGWEAYEKERQNQLRNHFAEYGSDDYASFFDRCAELRASLAEENQARQLELRISEVLALLADQNTYLFLDTLRQQFQSGNLRLLQPFGLTFKLMQVLGTQETYAFLNGVDYTGKRQWLFDFFQSLPAADVCQEYLDALYALYQDAEWDDLPLNATYLEKYLSLDATIFVQVTETMLQKAERDPRCAVWLSNLLDAPPAHINAIAGRFHSHPDVLKQAYLLAQGAREFIDHTGDLFTAILDFDPRFLCEYLEWLYGEDRRPSRYDDGRDYTFLWRRNDYEQTMNTVLECLSNIGWERSSFRETHLELFFRHYARDVTDAADIARRKEDFLLKCVADQWNDDDFMRRVFHIIAQFFSDRRAVFLKEFLQYNQRFEDFRLLPLETGVWSWAGSQVPLLQGRMDFFASLLPILISVELLEHRQFVQQRVDSLREDIEREKRCDFAQG